MADVTWQPVTVQLSALVPWDRNPKTISKSHAKRLLDLWKRLGQFQTIAIGPAGEVYDGHQRLSVLKAAHGPRFEVTALQSDRALTEKEREELTVAAHVGTTGQFSWDELSSWDAGDLQTWGFDAELLQDWNAGAAALATMLDVERPFVLGGGDDVDKGDRAGSSPWDRVNASGKIRCIVGDIEFGISPRVYDVWAGDMVGRGIPRDEAERWFEQNTPS